MKFIYRIVADSIFVFHFLIMILLLFGWIMPSLWYIYMTALILTLISDLLFGYCILSKWEFDLRKKINPKTNYDFVWATYYTYKLTDKKISNRFYTRASIVFLVFSIAINLYFKF